MRRANGICEYCLVPERVSALDFQRKSRLFLRVLQPLQRERCRVGFADHRSGRETLSSPTRPLDDHFQINGSMIVPITEVAEATARLLRFNDDDRVLERTLLQAAGDYPKGKTD
jgi:hypothetical protein